jgi:hypothetical protein
MPTIAAPAAVILALALLVQGPAPAGGASSPAPSPASAPASPGTACVPAAYREFDFWVGEWDVVNQRPPAGRTPPSSKSRITRILNGCAVLEEYETANGYAGKSLNFHDGKAGKWHQVWIDNGGSPLFLKGGMQGRSMVMQDESAPINRITWTPMDGGKVRQHWETSKDAGRTWQTSFDGLYTPRRPR